MGRNLSPVLSRELANLRKDAYSRKLAMKALKSYVKDLDSKAIPVFLAQVSETKDSGSVSGEYTISLYEVLARVHGPNIVPQIDSIMATIIKTLASSAGSFPLQQACSKVVPAIARYGIDPTTPEDKKRHIIHSLCNPLSDSLLGSQESLSSGAALCLKSLVDADNWRFASDEMVNRVCQNVAGALEEKSSQTNSHIGLAMALAKHNALIVEAYARLLIQSGLRILNAGVVEGNSQKRLSAIHMVNFLMRCLDPRSIFSELDLIIEEMEKCQSDQMAYVRGAAFEALQTAKKIGSEKESKLEKGCYSVTGSNFGRRGHSRRRNTWTSGDLSPVSISHESQTLDSFIEYDSLVESPISSTQASHNMGYDRQSVNRKLWSYENGGVDISLKDGLFSELAQGSPISNAFSENSRCHGLTDYGENFTEEFAGFSQRNPRNGLPRSCTPSPQRSRSRVNFDDSNLFTTPRKLIHSLQDPGDMNSDFSEKQTSRFRSPSSSKYKDSPSFHQNGFLHDENCKVRENGNICAGDEQLESVSESVSSSDNACVEGDVQDSREAPENKSETERTSIEKAQLNWKPSAGWVFGLLFVLLAVFCFAWMHGQDEPRHFVPT
ncbi:ARM repeat superfamily protein [Tripterygium wilfordii]|uniref:ARM repeat superfamily protein n=1 Tax=Tripterygium wilfordii TaxID=458696 RepID=A0A7J7DSB5_TRIWF|nr:protein SINE1-like [Tripterygium wilfordii]KAF5749179.1 ARM repeat superfamily protein [Tripterygium wilfordii]